MVAIIAAVSSTAAQAFEVVRRFSVKALNRHLEYCELLAEAQRRF
ncbi:hypothetical protein WJ542_18750 [Paraburkholderia sp. B3]|nr:hypothetical protein [Paraburkholderia acidipaludis]